MISVGQKVRVKVLEVDREKRRIRLGMKQLEPTAMDKFIAGHQDGEVLSGLVVSVEGYNARVEIGEGIVAQCRLPKPVEAPKETRSDRPKVDLASMTAMLSSRWKTGPAESGAEAPAKLRRGEVKQFKISKMDAERQTVEVELI